MGEEKPLVIEEKADLSPLLSAQRFLFRRFWFKSAKIRRRSGRKATLQPAKGLAKKGLEPVNSGGFLARFLFCLLLVKCIRPAAFSKSGFQTA